MPSKVMYFWNFFYTVVIISKGKVAMFLYDTMASCSVFCLFGNGRVVKAEERAGPIQKPWFSRT